MFFVASNFVSACLGLVSDHHCVCFCVVFVSGGFCCVFFWSLFLLDVFVSQRRRLFDVLCEQEQTQSRRCHCFGVQCVKA